MSRRLMITVLAGMLLAGFALPAASSQVSEVENLLKNKIDAVLFMLSSTDLAEAKKKERIMEIIDPVIDFPLMAKLTLGKQNWSTLSPDQRQTFVDLFVKRLKRSYLDKTTLYTDQKVTYGDGSKMAGDKVSVPMHLYTEDKTIDVIYKFYSANGSWKVYDVEVDGVSFIKSYRAQFDEILHSGTVKDLFAELKKPVDL